MSRILLSTGTLIGRPNGRNIRLLDDFLPILRNELKTTIHGLELLFFEAWYGEIDSLKRYLCSLDLPVPVFHTEKFLGDAISRGGEEEKVLAQFEINCDLARAIGSERLVLHLWGGVASDGEIARNFALYPSLKAMAGSRGLDLTIENVVCAKADPITRMEQLLAVDAEARFTYDTKMAAFHDQTLEIFAPDHRDLLSHIAHLHINDFGGVPGDFSTLRTLGIGEGRVDFARFFAELRACGYAGDLTTEVTCFDMSGAVDLPRLARTLRAMGESMGI